MATFVIGLVVLAAVVGGLIILVGGLSVLARERQNRYGDPACGERDPTWPRCPADNCRHRNPPYARFCARCGRPLKNRNATS